MNADGRGPAWSNSLFEDNAEFGLGMRLSLDKQAEYARELLVVSRPARGDLARRSSLRTSPPKRASRRSASASPSSRQGSRTLGHAGGARPRCAVADTLVRKSVWIVGGDGWAYDIGYGGLDHVLASGANVNMLVLDTEVYSNTGGQMSKATPRGAVAKFAAGGKPSRRKTWR